MKKVAKKKEKKLTLEDLKKIRGGKTAPAPAPAPMPYGQKTAIDGNNGPNRDHGT